MPDLIGGTGPSGPPTAFSALMVGGVPTMGMGGNIPLTNGNYYFVSSLVGLAGASGNSAQSAVSSVFGAGGAYSLATAANNDVIVCLPGHAETISSATGALMTKSGVRIVGMGTGTFTPTFTLGTANTTAITVSADNQSFDNCRFIANFLSIAACFVLTTAKWFSVTKCYFYDTTSILNFLNIVKSTSGANTVDGLTFSGNTVKNLGVTSNNTTILSANAIDRLTMVWNNLTWAVQNNAAIGIILTAGVLTNLDCGYNKGYRPNTTTAGGSLITVTGSTSTGWVYNNYVQTLTTATDLLFTTTVGLAAFNNFVTGVVGASGFLIPAADS